MNCVFRSTYAWTCIVLGSQLSHCLMPILLYPAVQSLTSFFLAFPITCKSKCKNDYLPSLAAVIYISHLPTCVTRHPDEFIEICWDGHNVLARQCIPYYGK
ncbi:hypothetical protein AVEN_60605-1 [Araneus ventricosus]|uniref:Uncharacterized protein n=1 Tax=Araneus ventricosus TaxID=182803 RepID=A0A4Y2L2F6_ARAVE|nr:hypothetical protein AVEN_60605-1 [Araneus ventricosus]